MSLERKKFIEGEYNNFHYYLNYYKYALNNDRDAIYSYLNKEVFIKDAFKSNIKETANITGMHYDVIFSVITNYLTDVFLTIVDSMKKSEYTKINIYGYIFLVIANDYNLSNKNRKILNLKLKESGEIK